MIGWRETTLGEAYDVRDGTHDSPKYQGSGYPLVTSKNLKPAGLNFEKIKYISDTDFKKINERSGVHKGDVLFAMIGTIGNPIVVDIEPDFAIKNVALLKVSKEQGGKFLKYYLESNYVIEKMMKEAKGSTQKFVGLGYLRAFPIRLPPIPEQKRIVAILDQVFADIEQARARTEQNLKNARELFESYLQQVFNQRGEGWTEKALKEVVGAVLTGPFGSMLHKSDYVVDGIPLVNPVNIVGDVIVPNESKTVTEETAERLDSYILSGGDLVIGRRGEIGRCAVISPEQNGWVCGTGCFYIKPSGQLNLSYLANLLRSPKYRDALERVSTGATMQNLSNTSLKNFVVAFPESSDEQAVILDSIKTMKARVRDVEVIYVKKMNALDELKKSILQKAFSGELTNTKSKGAAT